MINISPNRNSVYIPIIQTGFLNFKCDSTYPHQLNGIITENQFQESINRINQKISTTNSVVCLIRILAITVLCGMILFVIGGISTLHIRSNQSRPIIHNRTTPSPSPGTLTFIPLIGAGIALFIAGPLFVFLGCCYVQYQCKSQFQRAIMEESIKYSSRSSMPCTWRLEEKHVVIDIGQSNTAGYENQVFYSDHILVQPRSSIQVEDTLPPPPYSSQKAEAAVV